MNKKLRLIMMLCIMTLTLAVTGCSNDSSEATESSIIGTWQNESIHESGTPYEYTDYTECTYRKDGSVTGNWKTVYKNGKIEEEDDYGRYEANGNKLLIWWQSESEDNASNDPWTTTFTIDGDKMTTSENGGTVWTRKKQ